MSQPQAKYANVLLQCAYEIAEEAHKNQYRRDGSPYIDHPVMVCDILGKFGCSEMQQAVALLHDVVEDCKGLNSSALRLHIVLMDKLKEKLPPQTVEEYAKLDEWSQQVCLGVKELTNDAYRYEGKRTYQANKATQLNIFLSPIKAIDQAASVIDDIMKCDFTNEKSVNKARGFALKGFDVVRSAMDTGTPFRRFYAKLYTQFKHLLLLSRQYPELLTQMQLTEDKTELLLIYQDITQVSGEITNLRQNFDYYDVIEQAKAEAHKPIFAALMPDNVTNYYQPHFSENATGLERITVSEKGKVVSYGMIISTDEQETHPANTLSIALRDALEANPKLLIDTGTANKKPIQLIPFGKEEHKSHNTVRYVRDFGVHPPVDLEFFLHKARKVGAISEKSTLYNDIKGVSTSLTHKETALAF